MNYFFLFLASLVFLVNNANCECGSSADKTHSIGQWILHFLIAVICCSINCKILRDYTAVCFCLELITVRTVVRNPLLYSVFFQFLTVLLWSVVSDCMTMQMTCGTHSAAGIQRRRSSGCKRFVRRDSASVSIVRMASIWTSLKIKPLSEDRFFPTESEVLWRTFLCKLT